MENEILKRIYEKYEREIYLYIYSITKNKALSEDILQDTFLKALLSLPDQNSNLKAWLYKVARNLSFNEMKKAKRETCLEEAESPPLEFKEEKRELIEALNKLDKRKREVLLLQYAGGFKIKEIAMILDISGENVRVLSHRGKKELKKILEGTDDDI